MLTGSKLTAPALSLLSCKAYCSAILTLQEPGMVAPTRATCEAVSASPSVERRVRELVPIPRKERRKRSFMLRAVIATCVILLNLTRLDKSLLKAHLILQNRFVCDRLLGVVFLGVFEFLICGQRARLRKGKFAPNAKAVKVCSCAFSPTLGRSTL